MNNKVYIIVNRESTKALLLWVFSGKDILYITLSYLIVYFPLRTFGDELIALIFAVAFAIITGFLLIDMPDGLSIVDHVKKWYRYNYKEIKEYYYIPHSEIEHTEEIIDQETQDWKEYMSMINRNKNNT